MEAILATQPLARHTPAGPPRFDTSFEESVQLGGGGIRPAPAVNDASVEVQQCLPFWMQRFFALAVPEDPAGPLRLLDAEGSELARIPLPSP